MSNSPLSRRFILLGGVSLPFGMAGAAAAQETGGGRDLTGLEWDGARGSRLWAQTGGPGFIAVDDTSMAFNSTDHPAPAVRLSAQQVRDFEAAMTAVSLYYRSRNMQAPKLPILDDKFHVFFLDGMGGASGSTGTARSRTGPLGAPVPGLLQGRGVGYVVVPEGVHMMINIDHYLNPEADHPWAPRITLAHELVHALDQTMVGDGWEGIGGWWREGNIEGVAQHALGGLGFRPLDLLKQGGRSHAKNVGMRPYDVPLTLKEAPQHRPSWVRHDQAVRDAEAEEGNASSFFSNNATYFTSSFWRYLMKEEAPNRVGTQFGTVPLPGDFELLAPLRAYRPTDDDIARADANAYMDRGVPVLDRFLRERHPVWKSTGLHRAFPAFIAHFVEWPDQVVKSRAGLFAHRKWMDVLFMKGAPLLELTPDKDIEIDLEIAPLSARAIRFDVPMIGLTTSYPKITITASVQESSGSWRPIDSIHIGLRGQCLGNNPSQSKASASGRVRRWTNVTATPLKRGPVNGETVLTVTNVARDAVNTWPVRVKLTISLQVASATGQCSYHPKPIERPDGPPIHPAASRAPQGPDTVQVLPVERGASETKVAIIKDADLVRMISDMADANALMSLERESDVPVRRDVSGQDLAAATARMASGQVRIMTLELTLPRVEPGYVGVVRDAVAAAEWLEPAYAQYASLGLSQAVRIETDAVEVRITSSNEGTILGTYAADFDRGSQNEEAIFRGRIEGRFSLGVIRDETQDEEMPDDPAAILPTDFFVVAARAGMDAETLAEALREAASGMVSSTGEEPAVAPAVVSPGALGQYDQECPVPVTRADFEPFFQDRFASMPGLSQTQLTQARAAFLENWEGTKFLICDWKMGGR